MNDLMHHHVVLEAARDRRERLVREAAQARLVRGSRGRRLGVRPRLAAGGAWGRLRARRAALGA